MLLRLTGELVVRLCQCDSSSWHWGLFWSWRVAGCGREAFLVEARDESGSTLVGSGFTRGEAEGCCRHELDFEG